MKSKFFKNIAIFITFIILVYIGKRFYIHSQTDNLTVVRETQNNTLDTFVPKSIKVLDQKQDLNKKPTESKNIQKFEIKDENFDLYDKMDAAWLNDVKAVLDNSNFAHYRELRDNCEKEKLEAYKAYHEYLRKKFGENFKYNLSEDQSELEKKINEKYLIQLSKLLGDEKFKNYLKLRDQFNEKLRRTSGESKFIYIEF